MSINFNSNLFLKRIWQIKHLFFDKSFQHWADRYKTPNVLLFEKYGDNNNNLNICNILLDGETLGFFAYWKFSIIALSFSEQFNLCPYIDWTNNSPYYEPDLFGINSNPFDYYFEPVSSLKKDDIYESRHVLNFDLISDIPDNFSDKLSYDFDNQIGLYSFYNKKYFKIKSTIYESILKDINKLSLNFDETIGIHFRGVEWGKIQGHPIPPSLNEYFNALDNIINQKKYKYIFVASDSNDSLELCKEKYKDQVYYFKDALRSSKGSSTLMLFDSSIKRKNNHFLMGYEVLRDMITLSMCDSLIAGFSNVGLAARTFKESRGEKYKSIYVVRPEGISSKGISPERAVKEMKMGKYK